MRKLDRALAAAACAALLAVVARSQHCGGPCEVQRGSDPESPHPRYTLSAGMEAANWRYLFNWHWTEDGVQKHALEHVFRAPPLCDFAYRRMFTSPSGNGFLVTGNPYVKPNQKADRQPPLFVFCAPRGEVLVEIPVVDALTDTERKLGGCPSCDCCADLMYVFAQDPRVSSNGCFVELVARNTTRPLSFFLPWGCLVSDRSAFEDALEAGEWSRLTPQQAEHEKSAIDSLLKRLASDDLAVRTGAADALVAKGMLGLSATRKAAAASSSGDFRARATAVEARLRPLGGEPWEAVSHDLGLLGSALSYPEMHVRKAVRARLTQIVPTTREMSDESCAAWLKENRQSLKWDPAKGQHVR
jgi:hypothetical protein